MKLLSNSLQMKKTAAIFTAMLFFVLATVNSQTIYYVDASKADNTGAGTSWATAKKDLQNAITAAISGDAVWVKAGTYKPTEDPFGNGSPADPRDKTFLLKDGIKVYGGFNGTETSLIQRNISANVTSLSGDIGVVGDAGDNCYHVLLAAFPTITPTTTIDGFIITGGNANNATSITVNTVAIFRSGGGGIYTRNGTNTIANNLITGNAASVTGGGINTLGSATTLGTTNIISNNNISGNTATGNGGGIYMVLCSNTLNNNIFSTDAASNGGAVYINGGTHTLFHNTIGDNAATAAGGGIYAGGGSTSTFTGNSILLNGAVTGAGIYAETGSFSVTNNAVFQNNASGNGGGMYITVVGNSSFINNTVYSNIASTNGGGIFTNGCVAVGLKNNIFWNNKKGASAAVQGADYYEGATNGNTFTNNILQLASGNYSIAGSGNFDLGTAATGNLFATDPLFINAADPDGADNINGTPDDGLRLASGSPAVNAGTTSVSTPVTDITGVTRGVIPFDLGAYEWFTCANYSTLYVDGSVAVSGKGDSWATSYKTLDEAIFEAQICTNITVINVAAGTYTPSRKPYSSGIEMTTADPRDVTFHLRDNLALYGGFPNGGGVRNPAVNITTLSGDIGVANVINDNCYHVLLAAFTTITPTTTIDGFTITGGNANNNSSITVNTGSVFRSSGGGIFTRNGANTISNNSITGNAAIATGAGINTMGSPTTLGTTNIISNNNISGNTTSGNGGGIYMVLCTNTMRSNTINGNSANNGGGIYINAGTHNFLNNVISGNSATVAGGGVVASGASINTFAGNSIANNTAANGAGISTDAQNSSFSNNALFGNIASNNGGAIYANGIFNCSFVHNTVYNNAAVANGGGIYTNSGLNTQLKNNIFWNNKMAGNANVHSADYYEAGTNGNTFTNNLLQLTSGNYTTSGAGNYDLGAAATGNLFATDPLFINAADPDGADNIMRTADDGLRIPCASPVSNTGVVSTTMLDILGDTRNAVPDMGAYEANGNAAVNALPAVHTIVALIQNASVQDYTDCSGEIVKIDGSSPYTVNGNITSTVWIESSQPPAYVKRHYEIAPASNAATATARVTLYFTQAEFDAFNAVNAVKLPTGTADAQGRANLRIRKIAGSSSNGSGLPGTYNGAVVIIDPSDADIVWNNTASRWEVSFEVSGFSGFFAEATPTVLPLHWLSITGKLNNKQACLIWQVQENDIAQYAVEKSNNGIAFSSIAILNSKGDGYNSYTFTEPGLLQDIAYYRIKQTGINGQTSYSSIVKLAPANAVFSITVYPNPVNDITTISIGAGLLHSKIKLIDDNGRVLLQLMADQPSFTINMSNYPKGIYLIMFSNGMVQKIIKN